MTIPRFDSAAAWAQLSADERAAIGAAALDLIVASNTSVALAARDAQDAPAFRASQAAAQLAMAALDDEVLKALGESVDFDNDPPVPASLGDICTRCGCSEHDACDDGCAWHAPGLCTSCIQIADALARMNAS